VRKKDCLLIVSADKWCEHFRGVHDNATRDFILRDIYMLSCDYIQELYADFTVQEIGESVKEKRAEAPVEYWKIFCSLYVRVGILTEVFNNAESK
jgi:hypothetical protein